MQSMIESVLGFCSTTWGTRVMKAQQTKSVTPLFRDLNAFYASLEPTMTAFNNWAHQLHFGVAADHVGYKCASAVEFEQIRKLLEPTAEWMHQIMLSGRRVVYIKLSKPILSYFGHIHYLELSDQKPDKSQVGGFDHIEIYPTHAAFEQTIEILTARGFQFECPNHPHHQTQDIKLKNGFKIRFEPEPLVLKIKKELK